MVERLEVARNVAVLAGELILKRYAENDFTVQIKSGEDDLVTEVDSLAEEIIITEIQRHFPDDGIIAEESANKDANQNPNANPNILDKEFIWLIDPLDGTRGFIRGNGHFAIHLGLLHKNKPVMGIVYSPLNQKLYHAEKGRGAFCNDKPILVSQHRGEKLRLASSGRIIKNKKLQESYNKIPHSAIFFQGGSGLKICGVAEGKYDVVITEAHSYNEWDLCAPSLILEEAGGIITTLDGKQITYNRGYNHRYNPGVMDYDQMIIISNGEQHEEILRLLRES